MTFFSETKIEDTNKEVKKESAWNEENVNHGKIIYDKQWLAEQSANTPRTTNTFPCSKCKKLLGTKSHLKSHMRSHTKEKPFSCVQCQKQLSIRGNISRHVNEVHVNAELSTCPICQISFKHKLSCEKHIQWHKKQEQHKKTISTKQKTILAPTTSDKINVFKEGYEVVNKKNSISKNNFIRVSDPDIDYEKLMKQKGHKFKCTTCKKSFNDRSNCRKHIRLHTNTKIYHCKVCKKYSSPSSTNMNKYLNIHSVSRTMSYRCKTCKIQFSALSTVKKHILTHQRVKHGKRT